MTSTGHEEDLMSCTYLRPDQGLANSILDRVQKARLGWRVVSREGRVPVPKVTAGECFGHGELLLSQSESLEQGVSSLKLTRKKPQ